jgi:hypothetical protein
MAFWIPFLIATTLTTTASVAQQHRAAKKNKKASEASNRIQERRSAREKLDQLRQARIASAQQINAGAGLGMSAGTSGFDGQAASIGAQYGANAAFIDSNMADARESMINQNAAATRQSNASIYSGLSSMSMAGFQATGGFKGLFGSEAVT